MDNERNIWRGKSGQIWVETARSGREIVLVPEYQYNDGATDSARMVLSIPFFENLGMEQVCSPPNSK